MHQALKPFFSPACKRGGGGVQDAGIYELTQSHDLNKEDSEKLSWFNTCVHILAMSQAITKD
jgi:hypothetical protein